MSSMHEEIDLSGKLYIVRSASHPDFWLVEFPEARFVRGEADVATKFKSNEAVQKALSRVAAKGKIPPRVEVITLEMEAKSYRIFRHEPRTFVPAEEVVV